LMAKPNPYYAGSKLWMATVMDFHLTGNGYWLKLRDRGRRPSQIWWVPSSLIEPKGDEKTFISHYEYRPGAEPIRIEPENIVHFRYGMDSQNPRKGKSPLSSLLHEVFTDDEAGDFTAAILGNMGVPGVVIAPANNSITPGEADVRATKEYLKGGFTGDKRGEPLVMSGPTSVSQFGFSPQQLNLRDIRRIPEERVTACTGVPAIVCGLGAGLDRSTYANYAEARTAAYEDCIIPSQRNLSDDIHIQLLPDFEPNSFFSMRFGFDLSNVRVLQEDRNALAERMDIGVKGGWIRVSEARRALELEVEDSDEIYLRAINYIEIPAGEVGNAPAGLLSPGQQEQPALPPGESNTEENPQPTPSETQPAQTSQRKSRKRNTVKVERWQSRLYHALILEQHALTQTFTRELESDFNDIGVSCAETYTHMLPQTSGTNGHSEKVADVGVLSRMIVASILSSFDDKLRKRFEVHTARAMDRAFKTIDDNLHLTSGVTDAMQRDIIAAGGKRLGLIDLEKQTRESVFNAINEGNQAGHNPIVIARSIRSNVPAGRYINAGPGYRAQVIARTETNWAMNMSSITYYRESDEVERCMAIDGTGDEECAARDGQEFSFDEAESELADEHPNGTLCFVPVLGALYPNEVIA
jgi:HK97 family phage portal protein